MSVMNQMAVFAGLFVVDQLMAQFIPAGNPLITCMFMAPRTLAPPTPATLICGITVPVLAAAIVAVGFARVTTIAGAAVTLTGTVAEPVALVCVLPVAVIVMLVAAVDTFALDAAVSVRVADAWEGVPEGVTVVLFPAMEFVLQLAVTPAGNPATDKVAEPPVANEPPAVTVKVFAAVLPCMTLRGDDEEYVLPDATISVGALNVRARVKVAVFVYLAPLRS